MSSNFDVLIIGGGSAGISIASRLARESLTIAVVEPQEVHYYQPLWTLVGAGVFPKEVTRKSEAGLIPHGAKWIKDSVSSFQPEKNQVTLDSGDTVGYKQLIVTLGIALKWDAVKGLRDALGKGGVCSNYSYDTVDFTWDAIRATKSGNAIFTFPATPIKCAGAPQKIMYLAEEHFRESGVRSDVDVHYMSATASIFGIPRYREPLEEIISRRGINASYQQNLVEIRAKSSEAVFHSLEGGKETVMKYSMIHVTPPQGPPSVIAESPLADAAGWVDVDKHTLQHTKFSNVWSAGDCSSLPVSKTGAAVRKQIPVLEANIKAAIAGRALPASYDGYASCPLVTGKGKTILAEFGYDGKIMESFPFDQTQERASMYALKAYGLPRMYWHGMLKGRM